MRAVIGGIGYRDLRDHSLGPMVSDALASATLPPGVEVEDLSYNPVAVSQWLEAMDAGERPDRLVLVAALQRGREPGTATAYRWDAELPDPERIQAAVADAVTGVIHVDNTLIVLAQFGPLPEQVVVIEVEPAIEEFGQELSPRLAPRFEEYTALALHLATDDGATRRLPVCGLGGPGPALGPRRSQNGSSADGPRMGPPFPTEIRRL